MMNRNILDSVCTLFKKGAESNRKATYTAVSFPCHWEQRQGSYRTTEGEDSAYSLEMICNYPNISKGDKLAYGVETTLPDNAYTVVYVDALPLRGKVHHFEVYAK